MVSDSAALTSLDKDSTFDSARLLALDRLEHKIALSRLSLNIGFNGDLLANFIQTNPRIKRLGSKPVVALADYFDVSINEMIGRISYRNKEADLSSDPTNINDN